MSNWKLLLALPLLLGSFGLGYRVADAETTRLEAEYVRRTAEAEKEARVQEDAAALRYSTQAAADAAHLATLQEQLLELNAYLDASPTGSNTCLSGADTERLRGLW